MAVETHKLRWLIAIRLVAITSVAVLNLLRSLSAESGLAYEPFLYALTGLTYALSLIYVGLLRWLRERPAVQATIQLFGDLTIVTGLVYYFGGVASSFSTLYLVVITSAATLLSRRAAVLLANLAWLFYASLIVALETGALDPVNGAAQQSAFFNYNLVVHLLGFNAVALLVSYLAQHASRAEDALERKTEDLAQLEHFHRDVTSSLSSGLITTDLGGRVMTVNPAGRSILAATTGELVGKPIWDVGLLTREQWEIVSRVPQDGRRRDRSVIPRNGGETHIGFSVSRLHHHDGTLRGYIFIFQDVTHWLQLEQQVRIKDRMTAIGELSAGLAHEIGNPLAAISGSVQLLSTSVPPSSSAHRLLEIILNESRRLDRTIKGFLRFARPGERSDVEFDIGEALRENVELLRHSDEVTEGHAIELQLDPPSVSLIADRDQLVQIFWNLARNALRAMPGGGRLDVRGRVTGDVYRIEFRDTGRGMSDAERRTLFQPFKTSFGGGSGLGMAIVYQIVNEHGGELLVESAPDAGTTVTVDLPLTRARILETAEAWT
ncbi:MAG TPA: ATP-binding protein [Thermoanaerobaculia bacterium]|nr:ATP-binding protein [Thermoanaerobaculia bacterium]